MIRKIQYFHKSMPSLALQIPANPQQPRRLAKMSGRPPFAKSAPRPLACRFQALRIRPADLALGLTGSGQAAL